MKLGILWDLDGTLLDTLEDLTDATNYALTRFSLPPRTLAEIRGFVGNGARNQIARAMGTGPEDPAVDPVLAEYRKYYEAHCRDKTRPYGGVMEALAALAGKYPMAVVSNKPDPAVKALCRQHFPGLYARGERPDCPRKPAPDMLLGSMAEMGVDACVYVGDSEVDILTAHNAGMPCLSVLWGFRDREQLSQARYVCETPERLPEVIEKMVKEIYGQ